MLLLLLLFLLLLLMLQLLLLLLVGVVVVALTAGARGGMCRVANAQWRCRHSHPFALHFTYICQRLGQRPSPDPDVLIHRYDCICFSWISLFDSLSLYLSLPAWAHCPALTGTMIVIWHHPPGIRPTSHLPFRCLPLACQRQLTGAKLLPASHAVSLIVLWIAYTARELLTANTFGRQISCLAKFFGLLLQV